MTYNVHQLLHLLESVEELGPLWSHFIFFSLKTAMVILGIYFMVLTTFMDR